jgi:hypothetical protein
VHKCELIIKQTSSPFYTIKRNIATDLVKNKSNGLGPHVSFKVWGKSGYSLVINLATTLLAALQERAAARPPFEFVDV